MQIRNLIISLFKNGDQIGFRASWFNLFSFFFFNIIIANSFVGRGGNAASAVVLPVVVVIKY